MTSSGGWFFWAALSAVFAALTAIFAKIGVAGVDPDLATLIRTAVVIVVLAAIVAWGGKWTDPRALPLGDASKVAPVDKFSLVLVAVFAFAFLGERPSLREWGGIALVAAGVLVLAL